MRIAIIGAGYVGLVSAACFAEFGWRVTCIDKSAEKIARLKQADIPIYEPGLEDLVQRNLANGNLTFSTDLALALENVAAVFIAVGTPSRRGDGYADLSYVFAAAEEIAGQLKHSTIIVTKSTVPVGTAQKISMLLQEVRPDLPLAVASNPEFLREGSAIADFMRPDRVVIGTNSVEAEQVLRALYRPLNLNETPLLITTPESAELIKYSANAFLAMKISFINEIADLCEKLDADVQVVAKGLGLDGRIGRKFLHAGPGYGGSCFPKDTVALAYTAQECGAPLRLVETAIAVNERRKNSMAQRIIDASGGRISGKNVAILGVTFKPNTDDMRESVALNIIPALQQAGAQIRAFDPAGMAEAAKLLPNVQWCLDAYDALAGADMAVLLTEWNEFRALDLARVKETLRQPIFMDLRNVYKPAEMQQAGLRYISVGRRQV